MSLRSALSLAGLIALAGLVFAAASAAAEDDLGFVDGNNWRRSSGGEKRSYLIGVANLLNAEYAYQQKSGRPPTDEQSIIPDFWRSVGDQTLDDVVALLDDWYKQNPDRRETAVLDVIWDQIVEPVLPPERRR